MKAGIALRLAIGMCFIGVITPDSASAQSAAGRVSLEDKRSLELLKAAHERRVQGAEKRLATQRDRYQTGELPLERWIDASLRLASVEADDPGATSRDPKKSGLQRHHERMKWGLEHVARKRADGRGSLAEIAEIETALEHAKSAIREADAEIAMADLASAEKARWEIIRVRHQNGDVDADRMVEASWSLACLEAGGRFNHDAKSAYEAHRDRIQNGLKDARKRLKTSPDSAADVLALETALKQVEAMIDPIAARRKSGNP